MAEMGKVLHEFHNAEDAVTGLVVQGLPGKFHVALRDDDSGNCVPEVQILSVEAEAVDLAKKWAGVKGGGA